MAGLPQTSSKYSVLVTQWGNASVGHRARMTVYGQQKRGYSTNISMRTTARIMRPEQKLSDIPSSVLSDIVMCLNNPSPLGNNWRALADELLLSYQTVQSLDYHGPGGMMAGVLEIMFHRKVTVGKFKQLLEKMERLDVIEILIKAGFPANTICENETDRDDESRGDLYSSSSSSNMKVETTETHDNRSQTTNNENRSTSEENNQTSNDTHIRQPTKDLPDVQNMYQEKKSTSGIEAQKACKLTNAQKQPEYGAICEELVRARDSSLASNEVIETEAKRQSSIMTGISEFISSSYSGLCGRLSFTKK